MPLTHKQKRWIDKLKGKLAAKKIAAEVNVPEDEVIHYLREAESSRPAALFYFILILIPILFFVLLEAGLRLFNYGQDLSQWKEMPGGKLVLNPDVAYRYFYNTTGIPYSVNDAFDVKKKENTFRIFVIGESSAAGYPFSPNGSFAKYIRKRLQLMNPDKYIEVVNISMAAINSYALLDLFPGVLEQLPDLIICYTGHNEYYGALGVGSAESLGGYTDIVNTMLYLNKLKTTQLVRNGIKSIISLFSVDQVKGGTLMSRMAEDQQIPFNSEKYKAGIEQFRLNMNDIADMSAKAGVPFVIGTLISNLKDQPPFIPVQQIDYPSADKAYNDAAQEFNKSNIKAADSLFRYAKDLDALRFRAPEELNDIISGLAGKNKLFLVDIDSAFAQIVPGGIIGNEFMTDHLHPTLEGYQMMGKIFFEKMMTENLLPQGKSIPVKTQDSIVISDYDFSQLDSTLARYRIIILKSDWPYVKTPKPVRDVLRDINAQSYTDTLALLVVDSKLDWELAHRKLAARYLEKEDIIKFIREMDVLIDQYPFISDYYTIVSKALVEKLQFEKALPYLYKYYSFKPDAFSSRWIGMIQLSKGDVKEALKYLEYSRTFDNTDPQVLYNLAGAYAMDNQYETALQHVKRSLEFDKNNSDALDLKNQLLEIIKNIEAKKTN